MHQLVRQRPRAHYEPPRPPFVCADGFTLSVQANAIAYCLPRVNRATRYTHVEVACVSEGVPAHWTQWLDGPVYAYVPVEEVIALVQAHGGPRA